MNRKSFVCLLLVLPFFVISCGSGGDGDTLSGRIEVDGSSTVFPLTEAVAEEFRSAEPEIRVTVGSSGTGAGFKKFSRGEIDITDASREIQPNEVTALEGAGIAYQELTVALDGIAIVVHPDNDWVNDITVEELRAIWEPNSEVMQWSDIRSGWPDEDIHLYGPNTAHGTYDFFTEAVMGESGSSRTDYNAVSDYNVAVQGISSDQYALGYFGLAYYEENSEQLKLLGIDNGDGPVKPSLDTVKNGTYAPLSRSLYIYVSKSAAERPAVQRFVEFYLENSGTLAQEIGYVPLPDEEVKKQLEAFRSFHSDAAGSQTSESESTD
ncbi:MAG: PstS family phosphate ABC transporter substrate-binding protein [Balneolaceae bacterium]|nr:PstS family phosphate ABC transporter substrate-binding protein [Balneolaceae bacterium]